jgi:hypothetical protein
VLEFIGAFPTDNSDYLVRILSAENVFEGDRVLLDFTDEKLGTLVPAGFSIIDVTIGESSATISALGGEKRTVGVPTQFNETTLIDFAVEVEGAFQRGARQAGFVAGSNGDIASPVARLTQVADDLMERPRPVRIQFVTKSSASALEGEVLADAELHLTGPMRQRAEPEQQPESTTPDNDDEQGNEPQPAPAPDSEDSDAG